MSILANVVMKGSDNKTYLVPEGTSGLDILKGVPLSFDLSFLDFPVELEQTLRREMEARGLRVPSDFEKPGAYKSAAEALRITFKVSANEIVDRIRREQL